MGASAALLVAACSNNPANTGPDLAATGAGNSGAVTTTSVVPGSQADFEQNAGNRVFFGYDQYTLSPQAQQTLAAQADWLKRYADARVLVSGNCDERGTREYNLALGARRAESARAYLVSLGVEGSRITTVSYGKERPVDSRSTEEAWSMNRNATTMLVNVGS
jgi:peptidoglycan-associated lipoprotein